MHLLVPIVVGWNGLEILLRVWMHGVPVSRITAIQAIKHLWLS
jgi:hypothetical protein